MTQEQYERIIRAALSMKRSKFAMAEALALDIPHKEEGDGQVVQTALEEVAQQIVDMGGDEISWRTLEGYRTTAFWVKSRSGAGFMWREGSAFDAHKRAALGGMDYDEFAKLPRTSRDVQKMLGQKASSTMVKPVEEMTQTERVDMARALADAEPDIVTDAVTEKHKTDYLEKKKDTTKTVKDPSKSDGLTLAWRELEDVTARNIAFTRLITSRWEKETEATKGVSKSSGTAKLVGYYEETIALYQDLIESTLAVSAEQAIKEERNR